MARPPLKTPDEIEQMRIAGRIVGDALRVLEELVRPGVNTLELDRAAEAYARDHGAEPAFLGYPCSAPGGAPFPGTICASVNEEVVHGIPSAERRLREGDIISIDMGVKIGGFFGDAARTFPVGEVGRKSRKLLDAGRDALEAGTKFMRAGTPLSRVSKAIQDCAEGRKFTVVRKFVGHGIGREMHEPPQVPNFVSRHFPERSLVLEEGMVLALEPMINAGVPEVDVLDDGWTAVTRDRKLSVHFENTVAIGPDGPLVLTG